MKGKHNEGFSLAEVMVSMAILSAIVIPVCTSLVLCSRMDARAEAVLRARIAVSSAVEKLSAEGITAASETYDIASVENKEVDNFPGVTVRTSAGAVYEEGKTPSYYNVEVADDDGLVTVTTCIRAAAKETPTDPPATEQEGGGT